MATPQEALQGSQAQTAPAASPDAIDPAARTPQFLTEVKPATAAVVPTQAERTRAAEPGAKKDGAQLKKHLGEIAF